MTLPTTSPKKVATESSRSEEFMVNISDLKTEVFVREKLDEDRVFQFAIAYEHDPDSVPAINITKDNSIVAGRHRTAGATLAGRTQIRAKYEPVKNKVEHITKALVENVGGPLPLRKEDLLFVAKNLLREGASRTIATNVIENVWPRTVAKRLVEEAAHGNYRDDLAAGVRAVVHENMRPTEAAEMYKIDVEKLKEEISGVKKKRSKGAKVGDVKRNISTYYRSYSHKVSNELRNIEARFDEGTISKSDAVEVVTYIDSSLKRLMATVKDWQTRFAIKNSRH
jgi:hypothetical protein